VAGSGGMGGGGGTVTDRYTVATGGRVRVTVDGVMHDGDGSAAVQNAGTAMITNVLTGAFPNRTNLAITWKQGEPGTFTSAKIGLLMQWIDPRGLYSCGYTIGSGCSLTVSAYDQQLRRLEATFTGTFARVNGTGPETIAVTGGSFELAQ
jgi:hypothetical protein